MESWHDRDKGSEVCHKCGKSHGMAFLFWQRLSETNMPPACVVRRADNTATWCKRIGSQSIALLEESPFWLQKSVFFYKHWVNQHRSTVIYTCRSCVGNTWKSYHYAICWKVSYACVEKQGKLLSDGSVASSPPNSQPNEKPHDEIIQQQPHGVLDPKDPHWIWITKKMYGWPLHTFECLSWIYVCVCVRTSLLNPTISNFPRANPQRGRTTLTSLFFASPRALHKSPAIATKCLDHHPQFPAAWGHAIWQQENKPTIGEVKNEVLP